MSMDVESFFLSSEAWALRKYILASGYLQHFKSENPGEKQVYCVDTFEYQRSNGEQQPAKMSRALHSNASSGGVKLIKVATRNIVSHTKDESEDLPSGAAATMNGKLDELFPRILAIIGNKPALFFIEPSGSPGLSLNALKSILRRKQQHTEIIIKFDAEVIWKHALESCLKECGHTNRCTGVLRQLARILGLEKLQSVASTGPAAALVENYMLQISSFGFTSVAHCLRDAVGQRSSSYLIYCTRRPGNVIVLNDLVRSAEDRLLLEFLNRQEVVHTDNALETDVFLRRQELKHLMKDLEKGSEGVKLTDKQWRILCERFGEFHQNDFAIDVSDKLEVHPD
jgi:hypothetical protein